MGDDENFLQRWSRRKRGAVADAPARPESEQEGGEATSEAQAACVRAEETQVPVDPASLPSIDSIGIGSDVSAFLAAGVPADLTRAALRRAWSTDPTICNFIGLSENSWDFNAVGGVPGFGSVTAEDVRRLLDQVLGTPEAEGARGGAETSAANQPAMAHTSAPVELGEDHSTSVGRPDPTPPEPQDAAMQQETGAHEPLPVLRRPHGGALPQ